MYSRYQPNLKMYVVLFLYDSYYRSSKISNKNGIYLSLDLIRAQCSALSINIKTLNLFILVILFFKQNIGVIPRLVILIIYF